MRRSKVKQNISTLIFISFAIFLIAGTYSRYTSTGQANLTTSIAKWSIALTGDNKDLTLEETQTITFKVDDNENVVNNKIAPGVTATAIVELDLTGTEVAVDFDATIDTTRFNAAAVGASFDKLTLVTKLDNTTLTSGVPQLISLVNNSAFTAQNGKKTITLQLTWENDDLNNVDDTAMGVANRDIVVPITFTAKQHIADS